MTERIHVATWGSKLLPGVQVEVFSHYRRDWATGFEIEAVQDGQFTLRRRSDGAVLPKLFNADDIRRR